MKHSHVRRLLPLGAVLVIVVEPASAELDVGMDIVCPSNVGVNDLANVDVQLKNWECSVLDVRLMSQITGNPSGNGTLETVGVFGPVVAEREVPVPAASDNFPGDTCDGNFCNQSGWPCFSDQDCECRSVTPAIHNVMIEAGPPAPASLSDTVATYVILSEWGSKTTAVSQCLIALPEPASNLQLVAGVLGLLALAQLSRRSSNLPWERSTRA